MNTIEKKGLSFEFSISGEQYAPFPELLGRDNPYMLTIKVVDADATPVSGVRYTVTSTNDDAHLVSLDGMGKTYTSSEAGEEFYIEGLLATTEADLTKMHYAFSVDCETVEQTEKFFGHHPLRMGRLLRWGRPGISVKTSPDKAVFTTKTERVAKESTPGAKWNWGEKIDQCEINVGDAINGSGPTSPTENNDGSFRGTPEIDLVKFSNVSKATLQIEGGLSDDQFTAVLPFTEADVELYYFESATFTKPSVIVGVPAEVTCTLTGLDKKPRADVEVEWTTNLGSLNPATGKTNAQGVATTLCTATDAGSATVTVLSKAHRTVRATTPAVPVGPLVIVDPVASAAEYVVGHSDAVDFSLTLQAGGQPVSDLQVDWFVGDNAQDSSTSNEAGQATARFTFTAAQDAKQVVKARVRDTQVQTTFDVNVYVVEITDTTASATEYVLKHSEDVEFSIVLRAGGKPFSGKTVEWTVGGSKTSSTTDSTGKATFNKAFDSAGDITVSAKDPKSGKSHNFLVKVFAVEITNPTASASEYIVGFSAPIQFSVTLKADGRPMPNTKVEWSVAGSRKDETASDASGIATVTLDFSPGEHVVTAKVVSSGQSASFKVIATAYVFDVRWTAMYEGDLLADHPDLRFRLAPYTINVKVLDQKGAAVEGVNFVLSGNARSIGVQIEGADQEKVSTRSGVNFSMDSSPSEAPVELELQLSAPGASWIHHYKMGWLYRTYYVVVNNFMHQMSIAFIPTAGFDPENNPPSGFDYGAIELMVPSRGWRTSFSVRALGRSLQGVVWLTKDTELQRGDTVSFSRHVSDNGYLVVRAEDFIAQ